MAHSVLIVDDEVEVADMFAKFLTKRGFEALTANNALAALRICNKRQVDLILTDYNMPEVTGIELLKEVRKIHPALPVILMSGQADMKVAMEALREQAFDFLSKPIDSNDLLESVRLAIQRAAKDSDSTFDSSAEDGNLWVGSTSHNAPAGTIDVSVVTLFRPLDEKSDRSFVSAVKRLMTDGTLRKRCVLSLKNVNYINNMGLNNLLEVDSLLKSNGNLFILAELQEPVYRYLKMLGYLDYFINKPTLATALETTRRQE